MKTMKTFAEFTNAQTQEAGSSSFPTFTQVKEGKGSSCMSEEMMEKMNEMYEAMCEEMKACHEDETEMTAKDYMSEASHNMKEMMEKMQGMCEEYMM